jgi:YD repeat-containing protein
MNTRIAMPAILQNRFVQVVINVGLAFLASNSLSATPVQLSFTTPSSFNESNRQVVLEWAAAPARTYLVQSADDFGPDSAWKTEAPVRATEAGPIKWMSPESIQSQKFYRLILPQPELHSVEPALVNSDDPSALLYLVGQLLPTNEPVVINGQNFLPTQFATDGSWIAISLNGLPPGPISEVSVGGLTLPTPVVYGTELTAEQLQGPPEEPPVSASRKGYDYYMAQSDLKAAGRHHNPYFSENNNAGEMPALHGHHRGHVTVLKSHDNDCDGFGIFPATGELRCQETDLLIPGRGLDFAWVRTYRSRTGPTTAQGAGWDFSYNVSVSSQPDGTIILRPGNGRADTFYPDGTNGWVREEYFLACRDTDTDGFVDVASFADGGQWLFHPPGTAAAGKLAQIVDRNGNTVTLNYNGAGRLAEIVDSLNRTNFITYDPVGHITAVTDFSGRSVRYEYDGAGDLRTVISPAVVGTPTGNDFPGGKTNRYAYTRNQPEPRLNHNLVSATDGLGRTWLQVNYETTTASTSKQFDRVRDYLCGTTTHFIVLPEPPSPTNGFATTRVISNDGVGNVSEGYYDSRQRLVRELEFTGRADPALPTTDVSNRPVGKLRSEDPDFFETRWEWNLDSLCTRVIFPEGDSLELVYQRAFNQNAARSNRSHAGDLRLVRRLPKGDPDDDGDGVPDALVSTFEYDARFGSPATETRSLTGRGTVATGRIETGMVVVQGWDDRRKSKTSQNQTDSDTVDRKGWDGTVKGSTHTRVIADRDSGRSKGFGFVISTSDPRGNVTTGEYDDHGNTRRITFKAKEGASLTRVADFGYNAFGQLTAVTNAADGNDYRRVDTFTYHSIGSQAGYLQSIAIDEPGVQIVESYEYDARGNLTRLVDANGNDQLFTYNALDQCVTRQTQQSSFGERVKTSFHYDANDNLVRSDVENRDETDALVAANPVWSTLFKFDALNRLTEVVREISEGGGLPGQFATNRFAYDANHNIVAHYSPLAVSAADPHNFDAFVHDERNLLFREIRAPGSGNSPTNQYDYTPNGDLKSANKFEDLVIKKVAFAYDAFDRLTSITDPMSNLVTYAYDRNDNLILVRTYGETNDAPGDAGNRLLAEKRFIYDSLDRCVRQVESFFNVMSQKPVGDGAAITTFTYAPNGDRLSLTDDNGHTTRYAYDTVGRLVAVTDPKTNVVSYTYDACDNVLSVTQTDRADSGGAPQQFVTLHGYNKLHRLTRSADNVGNTNLYAYDSRGYLVSQLNPREHETFRVFDGLGRCVTTINYQGKERGITISTTHVEYDTKNRVIATTDGNTNTTSYAYDSLDHCVLITEADGTSRSLIWSPRSNLFREQAANGTVITNYYDALDRCIARDIVPGAGMAATTTFERFAYDGLSRLVAATNNVSHSEFTYDSLGNRTHVITDGWQMLAAYDAVGNRLAMTYPSGRDVAYTYNALDEVTSMSSSSGGLPPTLLTSYEYEGPGRLGRIARANGINSRYQWNGLVNPANAPGDFGWQQVSGINHQVAGGGTVVDRRIARYDRNQNRTERTQTVPFFGGGPTRTNTFAYDALDRIGGKLDSALGLIRIYELDANGNRVNVLSNGVVQPYIMDATFPDPADFQMNQYTLTPFVLAPEQYDANGNLISRVTAAAQWQFTYDYTDRLVAVDDLSGGFPAPLISYSYDALGQRVSKTIYPSGLPPVTTMFRREPADDDCDSVILEEYVNGTLRRTYAFPDVFDQKGRVMFTDAGETFYFLCDDLGNTLALADAAGNVVERYDYDDFGAPYFLSADGFPTGETESGVGNPFLFGGLEWEPQLGFYHRVGRTSGGDYFDPQTGQSTSKLKIDGGMPNRISMNVTVPKQTQGATFGEKVNSGLAGAFGNNPWSGGGPKAQDHNSSRSNKTASRIDSGGDGGSGSKAQDHNSSRSNKSSSKAQDHNSSRSNKTASAIDLGGGGSGSGNLLRVMFNPREYTITKKRKDYVLMGSFPMQWQGASRTGSRAQDHNSSRSNKTASIIAGGGDPSDVVVKFIVKK